MDTPEHKRNHKCFSVFDEGRTVDLNMAEGYKWRLETLSREMLALQASDEHLYGFVKVIKLN